jgi:hypothetical protein
MTEEKSSLGILYILLMIVPYFLPWFMASSRAHYSTTARDHDLIVELDGARLGRIASNEQ